ncbi:MAG: hypothetical protein WCK73_12725 [Deltaproteobacteria bacterium]
MKKLVLLALVAILVVGGGAILAILYFTDELPSFTTTTPEAAPPDTHAYSPVVMPPPGAPVGPSGAQRPIPQNLKAPAGIPMTPQPDPRADKMESVRQDRFESSMDALNRRAEERIRKAGKKPQAVPPPPPDSTPSR